MTERRVVAPAAVALAAVLAAAGQLAWAETIETVTIRGHQQQLHVYGTRGAGYPVLVSSGDGGWIHLAPHVAEVLEARGFFLVGFDTKAYLRSFTSGRSTLRLEDAPGDYRVIADYAAGAKAAKPILIGVSEGAALSVLAAADPVMKEAIGGVIGLGLSDRNELGWRWQDSVIYLTHGVPNEPTFSVAAFVDKLSPVPLAEIHSTSDEFAPLAAAQTILQKASPPKRLWVVQATDHRFSGNLAEFDRRLLEAIEWVKQNQRR
jgi:fermentation-respiration switch protein FrsA (DUF1100 family)